jgi:fibro-slime domain-containing protein
VNLDTKFEGGKITFLDLDFFPIEKGVCLENLSLQEKKHDKNFSFTLELETSFYYEGGETFSILGDDDIWLFINNQLAIDVGGIHVASGADLELDTAASSLGITIQNEYPFHLFFAERKSKKSSLKFATKIKLKPTKSEYRYQAIAKNRDAKEGIEYTLIKSLPGMSIDKKSGLLTWLPTGQTVQNFQIMIEAKNSSGEQEFQCFKIVEKDTVMTSYENDCTEF